MDEGFYADLLDQISDGVYFVDTARRITYWNSGAERISGYGAGEVLGHSCAEVFLHHKDGQRVPVRVRGQALRDPDGTIVGSVEVFHTRPSSPYTAERRAGVQDSLDPVTGLPPRLLGEPHLSALSQAVAEESMTLGVLFIDADHFKDVNDTFGHKTGDDVLRMLGQSLANGLRRGDVLMRWGGEEFLALLPGADQASLAAAAERVRMLIENSWIQKGAEQVRVTVSIGAILARAGETPDELVDRADRFMYLSKRGGRNRVTTDAGELVSDAEPPILGTAAPWDLPDPHDLDGAVAQAG